MGGHGFGAGLHGHVLFTSDAEVALDGAPAHGATIELHKAARANAGMPNKRFTKKIEIFPKKLPARQ